MIKAKVSLACGQYQLDNVYHYRIRRYMDGYYFAIFRRGKQVFWCMMNQFYKYLCLRSGNIVFDGKTITLSQEDMYRLNNIYRRHVVINA